MFKLYNYLSRKKETFKPIKKGQVGFYTCGPTVYNYAHIGNLRTYIFEDILRRSLEFAGYKVKHVMNITDVGHLTSDADAGEDKMEEEAKKHKNVWEMSKFYTNSFFNDIEKFNILRAQKIIHATSYIKQQIKIIKILIKKGYAYDTSTAIYFNVTKFKNYAKYSRQPIKNLIAGSRKEVVSDSEKKHPADFVLWFKTVGKFKNHIMSWPSPWGKGFPGWHIECSAISSENLGQPFDIHTGGVDHIFPHHTNEIAQSEAAYGKKLARYWLEGEHLIVDKKRMGKSLGNFYTLKDLENKNINPLAFRYLVLSAHYRSQLNFTWESLEATANSLERLRGFVQKLNTLPRPPLLSGGKKKNNLLLYKEELIEVYKKFQKAISDDLDTPKALAILWNLIHDYNKNPEKFDSKAVLELIYDFDKVLGLNLKNIKTVRAPINIQKMLKEREEARKSKNFAKADAIRKQIINLGWQIEDTPDGTQLKRK